jgi:hypothetical protein
MIGVNMQTSFLTPPFGFALFYLRGVAPPTVRTSQIIAGAIPFVAIQVLMLLALWFAPAMATWLPGQLRNDQQAMVGNVNGDATSGSDAINGEVVIPADENQPPYEYTPDFENLPIDPAATR